METPLRDERRELAISVQHLARSLDVHPNSVLRRERRERLPEPQHLRALAQALHLDTPTVVAFFDDVRPGPSRQVGLRGHGLRELRHQAGVPVRRLADVLGVLPATVYNWEAGRGRIPTRHLPVLAHVLGVPVQTVIGHLTSVPVARRAQTVTGLRRPRRRTGLSQESVARRIGTTLRRIGAWERGERPPLWAVRRLAALYGVPVLRLARLAMVPAPVMLDPSHWSPGDVPVALRALRAWTGLTQHVVADHCGCRASTVRGRENGHGTPSARFREPLERLYGLRPGALLAAYPPPKAVPAANKLSDGQHIGRPSCRQRPPNVESSV